MLDQVLEYIKTVNRNQYKVDGNLTIRTTKLEILSLLFITGTYHAVELSHRGKHVLPNPISLHPKNVLFIQYH